MPYAELWREFGPDMAAHRAATDGRGFAIFCAVMAAAAARLTFFRLESDEAAPPEELRLHAATIALALTGAALAAGFPRRLYLPLRPFLLVTLRIVTAKSPILTRSALAMIAWGPRDPALATLTAIFALLLEDHVLLQTLLALALPLNIPMTLAVQAVCVWLISGRNLLTCRAGVAASALGRLLDRSVDLCAAASLGMQVVMGVALPLWHIACADSAAAVAWWHRRLVGPPGRSLRYRAYAWIATKPCIHADVVQRATLGFAAVWLWLTMALWAAGL